MGGGVQGCKRTEHRLCWTWTINRFLARDVHGLLRQGQSSNRSYFQFRRHRFFLKYPSFGMNKPDRSLPTLQWRPIEWMGRGNYRTQVNGLSSGCASLQPCQRASIAHRTLSWQSWWEGRAPRGHWLLASCCRAAWGLLFPGAGRASVPFIGKWRNIKNES